jgi:hypothetical protein
VGRNVVVCCDGTANQFAQNNTNVVRLYSALVDDPARQLIFYHPGVGTMEAPGALTSWGQKATILAGMAVGYGLERDITAAYTFIMNNYKAAEDDRLFLFGFSRGAYTVRAVASLLRSCGILRPGHETSIPYAIRLMNAIGTKDRRTAEYFRPSPASAHASSCKPYLSASGYRVLGRLDLVLKIPYTATTDIQIGRHASPRRAARFYRPNSGARGEGGAFRAEGPEAGMVRRRPQRCGRRLPGDGERPVEDRLALDAARSRSGRLAGRRRPPGCRDRGRAGARSQCQDA